MTPQRLSLPRCFLEEESWGKGKFVNIFFFLWQLRFFSSDNYSFRREIRILEKLAGEGNHPNIVQFLGWCIEPRKHIIFLEYVPGGDLYDLLQKDDPIMEDNGVRMRLALDIANGMEYLHSRDPPIYHLDLKPNNVLISERDNAYVCKASSCSCFKTIFLELEFRLQILDWPRLVTFQRKRHRRSTVQLLVALSSTCHLSGILHRF